ncbi:arylsulfatase [Pelagicoccus mobilis]|uniref:Arylsulfatase n=1 Tax=Pelagicoccus mobilis TaxID=415221 RepID=A0A934S201_9BACT|nr:arylsulfatase [Pelagicoccus mobilis]MBK1879151.1 arylsulfatase [Pelagicoccus mobilis]
MKNIIRKTVAAASLLFAVGAQAEEQPNIVMVFMDNFGWGEVGAYGGGVLRGAPTPNIDSIADNGMKLLNFNVESQCVPSRSAIMTGRYAIRSGTSKVPLSAGLYGMTQWEYTMAEMLSDVGYNTGMFGKWHLGDSPGRYPTDQGFDEWWGIPNSSDESIWPDNDLFREGVHPQAKFAHIMEAKKGETPTVLDVYDTEWRAKIDKEITDRSVDYIGRKSKEDKPFFLFIPYTMTHFPVKPHSDFAGKTGNGEYADVLAQLDHYVGQLQKAVADAGETDNTIFIFTADNGPEGMDPYEGFAGPWSGTYFTGQEASLRVPFLIQWPGKIPARSVSNEITHEMDLFATFANIAGGKVPTDRKMDSVDLTDFLLGEKVESGRESVVIYNGTDVYGVKWRDWKLMFKELRTLDEDAVVNYGTPLFYNLLQDPKEERGNRLTAHNLWVRYPASQVLIDHIRSLKEEPPIAEGTPDPYVPGKN